MRLIINNYILIAKNEEIIKCFKDILFKSILKFICLTEYLKYINLDFINCFFIKIDFFKSFLNI